MKKIITFFLFLLVFNFIVPAQTEQKSSGPAFSGYLRLWHQTELAPGQGQFLAKEIRFGAGGEVNEYIGYKFLVDLVKDEVLLDALVEVIPTKNLVVTMGQLKVPFSTDNLRSGAVIDFVNRPLASAITPPIRDIGATVSYKVPADIGVELVAGAVNGSGINKAETDKTTDAVFRGIVTPVKNFNVAGNFYKGRLAGNDYNILNFGFDYRINKLFVDAEFTQRKITTPIADVSSNALFGYALYNILIGGAFLQELTPGFRYEVFDPVADVDENEVSRMTFGLTFSFAKLTWGHIRINYEKFDYKDGRDNPDKFILEFQARF